MQKQNLFLCFLLFGICIGSLTACKKDGQQGPGGPAGTNGTNGTNGQNGAAGAKGDTGVANVEYSDWTPVTFVSTGSNYSYNASVSAPAITQRIIDSGFVLVYFKENASITYFELLPKEIYSNGVSVFLLDYTISVGSVDIFNNDISSGTGGAGDFFPASFARYIVVPPGVPVPTDKSYDKVKAFYGIRNQ